MKDNVVVSTVKLVPVPNGLKLFAKEVLPLVRRSLEDPAQRADFERWYLKKHGKPYESQKVKRGSQ